MSKFEFIEVAFLHIIVDPKSTSKSIQILVESWVIEILVVNLPDFYSSFFSLISRLNRIDFSSPGCNMKSVSLNEYQLTFFHCVCINTLFCSYFLCRKFMI